MSLMTAPLNQLRDYTFTYFPWTNWQDFFRPTFYFGCNVSDADTERAVLDDVGSYGKQLNRVLDALGVLVELELHRDEKLTERQQQSLYLLRDLARKADAAAKRAQK